MRNRWMALSALVVFCLFLMVSSALADPAPPNAPAVLQKATFESVSPSDNLQIIANLPGLGTGPASWGTVTNVYKSGTHGLWCAGSTSSLVTNYPAGTQGFAVLFVPDASQYYQSSVQYSYVEPSLGVADANNTVSPFVVNWAAPDPTSGSGAFGDTLLPTTSSWVTVTHERGGFAQPPLSAGYLRFQFISDPNQTSTGQGVTIDDVQVTGYEFGPVNNISASRQKNALANVDVTWAKPSARGVSTPDPRTVYYRVWRRDVAANTWTELTSGGAISVASYADTSADTSKQFQYAVQSYDSPSDTTQWGVLATTGMVPEAIPHFIGMSGGPQYVGFGGTTQLSAPLVDAVGATFTSQTSNVVVERMIAGQGWTQVPVAVSENTSGTYSATVSSNVNASYRFKYTPTGIGSGSVGVTASAYLTTPSTPSKVKRNKSFTIKGSANSVPNVTRYVLLRAYHKETKKVGKKKKTVWVLRASSRGAVAAGEGVGAYATGFKIKLAGSWRVTATIADGYNPGLTSAAKSFSAK